MNNFEFLNKNFGTDYKGYYRCGWNYSPDILVWMVRFDKTVSMGWQNSIVDDETVDETFVEPLENQLDNHKAVLERYRLVVDKAQDYKILGLYRYDVLNSKERTHRVWKKIAESIKDFEVKNSTDL